MKKASLEDLLISTRRGQMINTDLFDCDYYDWLDHNMNTDSRFEGEFMSEYSWGEYLLSDLLSDDRRFLLQ